MKRCVTFGNTAISCNFYTPLQTLISATNILTFNKIKKQVKKTPDDVDILQKVSLFIKINILWFYISCSY